ncbi:MAG: RIP metalloprotease RseP [Peptococcaceae bacterium]|jgi:regulator of sigma E protease|nr:RIP metalloprotease RseP [Peptococcaceae bacterium]
MIVQYIVTVFVLGVIVLIHEWGHYISARSIGIAVQEFAIGIGPAIWKKQGSYTLYSIRAIPFGGYCLFDAQLEGADRRGRPLSILKRKALSKIYVSLAGPVMNFMLAAVLFTLLFSFIGLSVGYEPIIGEVQPDSPAAVGGLLPGDRILAIEGTPLYTFQDLSVIIAAYDEQKELEFRIQRGSEIRTLSITPQRRLEDGRLVIGVVVDQNYVMTEKVSPVDAIRYGMKQTVTMIGLLVGAVVQMVTGQISLAENLSGPISLAQIIAETASTGAINTFSLTAFLSVNLGIMNLLPLPALDGGKIILYFVEILRRKPFSIAVEGWINLVGFALIMTLMVVLTFKDILHFIGG